MSGARVELTEEQVGDIRFAAELDARFQGSAWVRTIATAEVIATLQASRVEAEFVAAAHRFLAHARQRGMSPVLDSTARRMLLTDRRALAPQGAQEATQGDAEVEVAPVATDRLPGAQNGAHGFGWDDERGDQA